MSKSFHVPDLKQPHTKDQTPLASLLRHGQTQKDYRRLKFLGRLLEQFHMKYAVTQAVNGRKIVLNGKLVINFGSANYLGLEQHPEVLRASVQATEELGTHAGTSRVFSSHANLIDLEDELSQMMGTEATLVGHNISQIHAGIIPTLFGFASTDIFIDRYAHTSMYQASLMAKAKGANIIRVDVSKLEDLEKKLSSSKSSRKVLLIDGVYSMQGHTPELLSINEICLKHKSVFYIDDAHGVGTFGNNGGGVCEAMGLNYDNILVTGSLQKALGTYGGFISGKKFAIDYLRVSSKAYIFSGTLQPAAVEGARAAVKICVSDEGKKLRAHLRSYSLLVRQELRKLNFNVPIDESPIVPVLIGNDIKTLLAGRKLYDLGVYLNSVLYPAVPKGQGILRISLSSLHTKEEIDDLIAGFKNLRTYLDGIKNPISAMLHLSREVIHAKIKKDNYPGIR